MQPVQARWWRGVSSRWDRARERAEDPDAGAFIPTHLQALLTVSVSLAFTAQGIPRSGVANAHVLLGAAMLRLIAPRQRYLTNLHHLSEKPQGCSVLAA